MNIVRSKNVYKEEYYVIIINEKIMTYKKGFCDKECERLNDISII